MKRKILLIYTLFWTFRDGGNIPVVVHRKFVLRAPLALKCFVISIFSNFKPYFRLSFIVPIWFLLIACSSNENAFISSDAIIENNAIVDTRFFDFYEQLGGIDVIGPAISPKFENGGIEYQYTSAALMQFNPNSNRYSLSPIGRQIGIQEPTSNISGSGTHEIYQGFLPIYDSLSLFIGDPITPIRYNETRGGIEQYFENLGLYQLATDPPHEVKLMYYGAWMCGEACEAELPLEKAPETPASITDSAFAALTRLGTSFSGQPLSSSYEALDGAYEQIFENIVVISDPTKPGGIALRPITAMVGIGVNTGKTFDVPRQFHRFITDHSGYEFTGAAVTEYTQQNSGNYRQCFTNICLDYFPNYPEELQVQLTPLGYLYQKRFGNMAMNESLSDSGEMPIQLSTSEGYSVIAPDVSQLISVYVYEDHAPIGDVIPTLTMTLPGGEIQSFTLEATRASDGFSTISLNPIDAPHGTRIDYQVCVPTHNGKQACVHDFFLIWEIP